MICTDYTVYYNYVIFASRGLVTIYLFKLNFVPEIVRVLECLDSKAVSGKTSLGTNWCASMETLPLENIGNLQRPFVHR